MNDQSPQDEKTDLNAALRRGASVAFVLLVVGAGLLYLSEVLLARWMGGADEFGHFALAFSCAQVVGIFAGLGLPLAVLRFLPQYLEHAERARLAGLVRVGRLAPVLIGISCAVIGTVATQLVDVGNFRGVLLAAFWLAPLLALVDWHRQAFRSLGRIVLSLSLVQVLQPVLVICGGCAVIEAAGGLSWADGLWVLAGATTLVLAVQWTLWRRVLPAPETPVKPIFEPRLWLGVALPMLLVQESYLIMQKTDVVMIGAFLESADVGRYHAAARSAGLVRFLLVVVNFKGVPMISALYSRGDFAGLERIARHTTRLAFWPSAAAGLGLCLLAEPVLGWFGGDYAQAVPVIGILVAAHLVGASLGPVGAVLNFTGLHWESGWIYGWCAAVNLVLNLLLIPRFGIEGAAAATATSVILRAVWAHHLVRKHLKINTFVLARRRENNGR